MGDSRTKSGNKTGETMQRPSDMGAEEEIDVPYGSQKVLGIECSNGLYTFAGAPVEMLFLWVGVRRPDTVDDALVAEIDTCPKGEATSEGLGRITGMTATSEFGVEFGYDLLEFSQGLTMWRGLIGETGVYGGLKRTHINI